MPYWRVRAASFEAATAIEQLLRDTDGVLVLSKRDGLVVHYRSQVRDWCPRTAAVDWQTPSAAVCKAIRKRGLGEFI